MNAVDGSEHYERRGEEQNPSLLAIILDTNPGAWALLSDTLPLSSVVANILVFINAHLACNYTNEIAVIASHCTTAQWLYPSKTPQHTSRPQWEKRTADSDRDIIMSADQLSEPAKRLRLNGPEQDSSANGVQLKLKASQSETLASSNKYRPFRLIEEELLRNLTSLLTSTSPADVSASTSTMVAGALTLALSYINRESVNFAESNGGISTTMQDSATAPSNPAASDSKSGALQSRILLLTASPSTDLAHQYIPIMNSIFACQRLRVPIDICQITPNLPTGDALDNTPQNISSTSTVFLQQASDATKGIYIHLPPALLSTPAASQALLTYLLTAFLPSPQSRTHLILPTRIDVDFRAACFCHRRIVDIGFVCSICLSIFCSVPDEGICLTCGTSLTLGDYGGRPIVVAQTKRKKKRLGGALAEGSRVSTPGPS